MGSRFAGYIEPGLDARAAPALRHAADDVDPEPDLRHPLHDIHCGMRGYHARGVRGSICSPSRWEYASEMVLKAASSTCATAEVPVRFYKDREGRLSHHKRAGWLSPWIAGWINLR